MPDHKRQSNNAMTFKKNLFLSRFSFLYKSDVEKGEGSLQKRDRGRIERDEKEVFNCFGSLSKNFFPFPREQSKQKVEMPEGNLCVP